MYLYIQSIICTNENISDVEKTVQNFAKTEPGQAVSQTSDTSLRLLADVPSKLGHLNWEKPKQSDVCSFTSCPVSKRCYTSTVQLTSLPEVHLHTV